MWTYLFHLEGFLGFYGCFEATNTPKSNLIKCRIRSLDRPLLEKLYSSVSLTVTKYSSLYFHSLSVLFFLLFVSHAHTHRSQTQTSIGHSSMWTWSWGLQPCNLYPAWYGSLLLCVMLALYSRALLVCDAKTHVQIQADGIVMGFYKLEDTQRLTNRFTKNDIHTFRAAPKDYFHL